MIYRFTDTPEIEGLELDCRASGGRLRGRTRGSAPRRCVPAIHACFARLNTLRPVRARGDGHICSLCVPPAPSAAHTRRLENLLRNRLFGRRTPMAATLAVTDACQPSSPDCSAG